ncbi:hypothetical protein GGS26DRAFT_584207 [Hypomontagnella submonticulosa]|nr:hypothetical protein GGS26DRAFT_584207 [Hypomontagnella submonticulosa]
MVTSNASNARTAIASMASRIDYNKSGTQLSDSSCQRRPGYPPQLNTTNFRTSQPAEQGPTTSLTIPSSSPDNHIFTSLSPQYHQIITSMKTARSAKSNYSSGSFLQEGQLNAFTPALIKEELRRAISEISESVLNSHTSRIVGTAAVDDHKRPWLLCGPQKPGLLKTFTILVLIGKVECISSFIDEGLTDSVLPIDHAIFQGTQAVQPYPSSAITPLRQCFANWTLSSIEAFIETQWVLISPFLGSPANDVRLHNFPAESILPIFNDYSVRPSDVKMSGYSHVRKVKIHPRHHNFRGSEEKSYFALKELRSHSMADFQREVAALRPFAVSPLLHVIKLLVAFRHGTSFYLLFPWAEGGSLRSYWMENPNPILSASLLRWIAEQCLGIAIALRQIHNGHHAAGSAKYRSANDKPGSPYNGRHGDVKPANILLFKEETCHDGLVWALSDFGLAKLHHPTAKHGAERPTGFSPTYRAPELDIKGTIDSAYDIWSFGCVLLELLTWLLHGCEGVDSFALSRVSRRRAKHQTWKDDGFFSLIVSRRRGTRIAQLKPSVIMWIDHLAVDKSASPYIIDLLSLTRNDLLEINWAARANISLVIEKLQCVRQKCIDDPTYMVPIPRPRKPPWSISELSSYSNFNKPDFMAFDAYSNLPIRVNMAHIPNPRDLHNAVPIAVPPQNMYWPGLNEQPHDTYDNVDVSSSLFRQSIPTESVPNDDPHTSYLGQYNPVLDQALIGDLGGRKRILDGDTSLTETRDERRKKARKNERLLTADILTNNQSVITRQGPSPVTVEAASKPPETAKDERLFACPFHKQNPAKYSTKTWKACIAPGWKIPRLKEHIYRKHCSSGHRCGRCLAEFKSVSELHRHHRSDSSCQKRETAADIDTIDQAQKAEIQKKPRGISDEEKWRDIYRIVFKLDASAEIPSPYCDSTAMSTDASGSRPGSGNSLAEFEAYLHRLADGPEQQNAPVIRNCLDLVQRFQRGQRRDQERERSDPSALDIPSLTYDGLDDATRGSESQTFPSLTPATSRSLAVENAEELNDLHWWDASFAAQWNEVFPPDKPYGPPGEFELGEEGCGSPEG